jgi:DNA primase large subunit
VLRKIEEMKTRNLTPEMFRTQLDASIKANLTVVTSTTTTNLLDSKQSNNNSASLAETSKKLDVASHFILRAAYCRTEDLRRWFLTQECLLFRHRLESVAQTQQGMVSTSGGGGAGKKNNDNALRNFLANNDFDLECVTRSEKEKLRDKLLSVPGGMINPMDFHITEYYRVPFVQALELVAKRECYVVNGYAYVPLSRIVSIVAAKFRASLSKSLALAAGVFGQVAHDEQARIGPLLKSMNSQYTGPGAPNAVLGADGQEVLTAATVDALAAQSMPLCMKQLHKGLQRDHKLKHVARLQYGLFLKGAGMSLEEHTLFFHKEFTRIMSSEQFNKEYSYNIRHMHGKEGKRGSYTPYNCMKIILGNPPNSGVEHHGCPYKHYDDANLSALLGQLKIGNASDREAIMAHKRDGNYQLACTKHFEVMHPMATGVEGVNLDGVGNHPNAWFSASVSYHNVKSRNGALNASNSIDVMKIEG